MTGAAAGAALGGLAGYWLGKQKEIEAAYKTVIERQRAVILESESRAHYLERELKNLRREYTQARRIRDRYKRELELERVRNAALVGKLDAQQSQQGTGALAGVYNVPQDSLGSFTPYITGFNRLSGGSQGGGIKTPARVFR